MNERKIYNYIIYWKNKLLSFPFGDVEKKCPNKILMQQIRKKLLALPMIYQKIPFEHFKNFPFYRDPTERLKLIIKYEKDIYNKNILDLGCSLGFFCFSFSKLGANKCVGIDADSKCIEICNLIKKLYNIKNVYFINSYITPEIIKKVGKVDFTIFFSTFHYILTKENIFLRKYGENFKKREIIGNKILSAISSCSRRLYFEMATPLEKNWKKHLDFMLPNPEVYIKNMLLKYFKKVYHQKIRPKK
jgi:SAM-dependent methyltransferase